MSKPSPCERATANTEPFSEELDAIGLKVAVSPFRERRPVACADRSSVKLTFLPCTKRKLASLAGAGPRQRSFPLFFINI